ncbi:MAG: hypothetical protein K9M11_01005 [Candidatus Pacebacteria bacterium]|nr:hypothetical protein [Candidatus Paceibacterota bacterium]
MKNISTNNQTAKQSKQQGGFLQIIVAIIIALVILNVLGVDLREVLAKPWVREFGAYIVSLMRIVWQDILLIIAFFKDLAA